MKYRGRGKSAPIARLTDIISRGYFQQVRFFVDLGIDIDQQDVNNRSPLVLCAVMEPSQWGTGIARLLIEKGAIIDSQDKYGMNALHLACIYNRLELVKVLLHAIDFDLVHTDKWGNTALHYAVRSGNSALVEILKDTYLHYKYTLETKNKEGLTALDEGYRYSQSACVAALQVKHTMANSDDESVSQHSVPQLRLSHEHLSSRSVSDFSFRRTLNRPKTAHILHKPEFPRECSTMSNSSSTLLYPFPEPRKFIRQPRRDLQPNEKDPSKLIFCADTTDFRNHPEYLYQLLEPGVLPTTCIFNPRRSKSALPNRASPVSDNGGTFFNWRIEFKKLYVHYEYQCTQSYRDSMKTVPTLSLTEDKSNSPLQTDNESEDFDKGSKKGRKHSSKHGERKLQTSQQGKRKLSIVGRHSHSPTSLDGSLGSSSESLSSGTSSKRMLSAQKDRLKVPSDQQIIPNGRTSRASNREHSSSKLRVS